MEATIDQLAPGDTVRLPGDTRDLTIADVQPHVTVPHILHVTFREADMTDLTMPAKGEVEAISMPRVVKVPCLLCKNTYDHNTDLTEQASNPRGVCGPCNTATTTAVLKRRAAVERQSSTPG